MRIIIVRHGETPWNRMGRLQGRLGGPLTRKGLIQAKRMARMFSHEKVSHIFSSPLERAVKTALEIAALQEAPVEFADELREIDCGIFENKTLGFVLQKYPRIAKKRLENKYGYCFPKGESYEDVEARVLPFVKRLEKNFRGKTAVIVTHEAVSRVLLRLLLKISREDVLKISHPQDCAYFADFYFKKNKRVLRDFGYFLQGKIFHKKLLPARFSG